MPTYYISDQKFELGELQLHGCVYNQPRNHPKNPLPGGEEIIQGDLTIPPTLTEIQKSKGQKPYKNQPTFLANKLEKNLDEIG